LSNEKQYPAPDEIKGELEQYLAGPEAEANEQKLNDAQVAKAKLEELGVEIPAQLQSQIEELEAKNPLNKVPKWATRNEWIKVMESRKDKLQKAIDDLGDIKPAMRRELEAEIARIDEKLVEPKEEFGGKSRADYAKSIRKVVGLKDEKEKGERTLTPEQAEQLLNKLEKRFNDNKERHEKVDWEKVKSSLEANPEALWSIDEMEKAGHEPDVYFADDKGFDVGTCSKESPEQHRNIVYDEEARRGNDELRSAVEIAEEMGIDLMEPDKYKNVLQAHGKYDLDTLSWLKTSKEKRKAGLAFGGRRFDVDVFVSVHNPSARYDARAFRGSLRVLWS